MEPIVERIAVGVDIGQRQDPTAVVVCEVQRRDYVLGRSGRPAGGAFHFVSRHVERLPLGTTYPAIVDRLVQIHNGLMDKRNGKRVRYWLDATGVGQPVVDLLHAAGLRAYLTPVYLTGTDRAVLEDGQLRLGKALLVSRLQVLLQAGLIHLPQTAEAKALVDELLIYEIRINDNAHAQFGAFKIGQHDDLATALGLACWNDPTRKGVFVG